MSNVTRVLLSEDVSDFIAHKATIEQAYHLLNLAVDVMEQQQRPLQLSEVLHAIKVMPYSVRGGEPWLS